MDVSRYKDYMLGLMFYNFLTDKTLETYGNAVGKGQLSENELVDEYVNDKAEYGDELEKMIQGVLGYYVSTEALYQIWLRDINSGNFKVQKARVADKDSDIEYIRRVFTEALMSRCR